MVVALKNEDRILVGISICDSVIDMSENDLSLTENVTFWKVRGTKDCYVFVDGECISSDVLHYNDYIFKDITDCKSIITKVVPRMKKLLNQYSRVLKEESWERELLIVKRDKMFAINNYFIVREIEKSHACGKSKYLLGGLEESRDENPEENILFAVRNFCRMKNVNLFPLTMFDTKTKKKKVYYK